MHTFPLWGAMVLQKDHLKKGTILLQQMINNYLIETWSLKGANYENKFNLSYIEQNLGWSWDYAQSLRMNQVLTLFWSNWLNKIYLILVA